MSAPTEDILRTIIDRDRRRVLHLGLGAFRNHSDAEDVAQEVFIRVWQRIQAGHSLAETPTAWVMRVTVNHIRDRLRTPWQRRVEPDPEAGHQIRVPSAEEVALHHHPPDILDTVHGLAPEQRDVVLLFYVADQSIQAISETLGIRENTVKTRLHRARKHLARGLKGGDSHGEP